MYELLYPLAGHAEHGDEAKLLAGGHSLLPMMKVRPAPPGFLMNVGHLDELRYLRREGVAVGALTRHSHLVTPTWCGNPSPLLSLVASHIGDPQVRHRSTIGGSLAHADPTADMHADKDYAGT